MVRWDELMLNAPHIPVSELRQIQVPVLISGADDDLIKPEHLLTIYRNLPHAQLSIMAGATHDLHQNEYGRFNTIAERLLMAPFTRPSTKEEIEAELTE